MSTPADLHDCALCEQRGTLRCSGCERIWFCGAQCQNTLWPVHKVLCGADPDVFRQAPLSDAELADFRTSGEQPYAGPFGSLHNAPLFKDVFEGSGESQDPWEELLQLLQTPVTSSPPCTDEDDDVLREAMLAMARLRIGQQYNYDSDDLCDPPESLPWLEMAQIFSCVGMLYENVPDQPAEPHSHAATSCKELNAFFRQQLISCAIVDHVYKAKSEEALTPWVPLLLLARDRAVAEIERASLSSEQVREELRALVFAKYEEMRDLGVGQDGRMRPASHP